MVHKYLNIYSIGLKFNLHFRVQRANILIFYDNKQFITLQLIKKIHIRFMC